MHIVYLYSMLLCQGENQGDSLAVLFYVTTYGCFSEMVAQNGSLVLTAAFMSAVSIATLFLKLMELVQR